LFALHSLEVPLQWPNASSPWSRLWPHRCSPPMIVRHPSTLRSAASCFHKFLQGCRLYRMHAAYNWKTSTTTTQCAESCALCVCVHAAGAGAGVRESTRVVRGCVLVPLSLCLSVSLSLCLSVSLSLYNAISLYIFCLPACLPSCLPSCLPACLSVSVYLSVCLSVCLPACLLVYPSARYTP